MKFKKTVFFILFLLCLLIIGGASAADNITAVSDNVNDDVLSIDDGDDTKIEQNNNDILEYSNADELKENPKTFDELRDEIENAPSGAVINITKDYYSYENTTPIVVKDNITIDGCNSTFDGINAGIYGLFKVSGENVVLKNMIFVNWRTDESYNIIEWFGVNGTLEGCSFTYNTAILESAVDWTAYGGTISNCRFENNYAADSGAALRIYSYGTTVRDSTFRNNRAEKNGGAIYIPGNSITLKNCDFEDCISSEGGAVYIDLYNNLITDCRFTGCNASTGGAVSIYGSENIINNSRFSSNSALEIGGAVYLVGDGCCINNTRFESNKAIDGGGAIFSSKSIDFDIYNCTFISNSADLGGAVIMEDDGRIAGSKFESNSAEYAGALYANGIVLINDTEFNKNTADMAGALILMDNCQIFDSDFTNNKGTVSCGSIVLGDELLLILNNTHFKNNVGNDGANNIVLFADATVDPDDKTTYDSPLVLKSAIMDINPVNNITYGDTLKITAIVYGTDFMPLKNGTISTVIDGKTYKSNIENGSVSFNIAGINAGNYNCYLLLDLEGYSTSPADYNFVVSKLNATISANTASYVINYGGKYSITLKGSSGNALEGQKVTFTLNGKNIGSADTNADGIATIFLTENILKTAKVGKNNLVITFNNVNYNEVTKTVEITINKENTKIAAKNKKFKKSKKVKKYTISLKNSKGKAVKNVKVTLKVKGKTYTAKTNKKGKAIFKIKKLTKKGKYVAVIKFKGNAYYNACTKKVKLTIKK